MSNNQEKLEHPSAVLKKLKQNKERGCVLSLLKFNVTPNYAVMSSLATDVKNINTKSAITYLYLYNTK